MHYAWLLLITFFSVPVYAIEDYDTQQIEERIKPVGSVNVEGETGESAKTVQTVEQTKKSEVPGEATFQQYCSVCHQTGVAGAPKFRNADDWNPRLSNGGFDALFSAAMHGLNAMPPKGTCQECSEQDIKDAIHYMLPKS